MLITQQDIDEFVAAFERRASDDDWDAADERLHAWLCDHPQVVIAAGYQEYVAGGASETYRSLVDVGDLDDYDRALFREFSGSWIVPSTVPCRPDESWMAWRLEKLMELNEKVEADPAIDSEAIAALQRKYVMSALADMPSIEQMVKQASKYIDNPLLDPTTLVSPKLWTPHSQAIEKDLLQASTLNIIELFQRDAVSLAEIHWRQLEELVAEILRSRGMEIHIVKESPQGGRDIIARAQLIPGSEVVTIAVEVKHRRVVDRPVLQQAIRQNRNFPALMLVTSGRFTAGVVREVSTPENRMRVLLKDGIAIRDMIQRYPLSAHKHKSV